MITGFVNKLYFVFFALSALTIGALLAVQVNALGWNSLWTHQPGQPNLLYAIGFWLTGGAVAGIILGKMDAVVVIGNADKWSSTSALDRLIVLLSCATMRNGHVVQLQMANLLSGPIGVGIVYLACLGLYALTGNAMFSEYPGYTLMVIPFVTAWKFVENWTSDLIVRRHFQSVAV